MELSASVNGGKITFLLNIQTDPRIGADCVTFVSNFLLFMPPRAVALRSIMSYYQSSVNVTHEGDVNLSNDTIQGLGTSTSFLSRNLFGAIGQITSSAVRQPIMPPSSPLPLALEDSDEDLGLFAINEEEERIFYSEVEDVTFAASLRGLRSVLTQFVPDPGYFLAGGVSGVASRTTTAPLDRLKVYLIARTDSASEALAKAKSGAPLKATQHGASTLVAACKDLWSAGGIRSLFAGT